MSPDVGSSRRLQQRSIVLLPEPEGPMTKMSSPSATLRSIFFRMVLVPKRFSSETISSMGRLAIQATPAGTVAGGMADPTGGSAVFPPGYDLQWQVDRVL